MFLLFDDIAAVTVLPAAIVQTSPVGSRSPIIVKPPAESGIALAEVPPVTTTPLFWPEMTSSAPGVDGPYVSVYAFWFIAKFCA